MLIPDKSSGLTLAGSHADAIYWASISTRSQREVWSIDKAGAVFIFHEMGMMATQHPQRFLRRVWIDRIWVSLSRKLRLRLDQRQPLSGNIGMRLGSVCCSGGVQPYLTKVIGSH